MKKNCTLEDALNYNNEDVIFRFTKIYDITEEQSSQIFNETKKWLWLCYKTSDPQLKTRVLIDYSMLMIDEMWHNFILFSKDYENYCLDKFGFFIYHQPTTKSESLSWKNNSEKNTSIYLEAIKKQYSIIFDYLGEETLKLWYKDFAKKYSKEKIKELLL